MHTINDISEHLSRFFSSSLKVENKDKPVFYLNEDHPLFDRYEIFYSTIDRILKSRNKENIFNEVPLFTKLDGGDQMESEYLKTMFDEIQSAMKSDIAMKELWKMDRSCCGHVDYLHKFAYRLAEYESKH